jgi:hypothetical protein
MKSRLLPIPMVTFVAAAAAQVTTYPLPTRGVMSAYPVGMIMSSQSDIQKKKAGLPIVFAATTQVADVAHYSVPEIMEALGGTAIEIDAMSSGNDALPLVYHTATQEYWVGNANVPGWAVLHLAIDDPLGLGSGAQTVMGYYFANPAFPSQLRSGIYHELIPRDFPTGAGDIVAMDAAMGMLEDNRGRLEATNNPVRNRVYFSLTPASAAELWSSQTAPLLHVSLSPYQPPGNTYTGATIFVAEFDAQGQCTTVRVCEDYSSLGLSEADDVDALAVADSQYIVEPASQPLQPTTLQFVFSTATPIGGEELLVAADVSNGPQGLRIQKPLRGNNGDRIVGGGGSIGGPVRSICSQDPENVEYGCSAFGEPEDHAATGGCHMSLSLAVAHRNTGIAGDAFELVGVVSGWGTGAAQDSLVYLAIQLVANPLHPLNGWTEYFPMGTRLAGQDEYVVRKVADVPWLGSWIQPNGPDFPNRNRYRFWVHQVASDPTNPATFVHSESIRHLVYRRP